MNFSYLAEQAVLEAGKNPQTAGEIQNNNELFDNHKGAHKHNYDINKDNNMFPDPISLISLSKQVASLENHIYKMERKLEGELRVISQLIMVKFNRHSSRQRNQYFTNMKSNQSASDEELRRFLDEADDQEFNTIHNH